MTQTMHPQTYNFNPATKRFHNLYAIPSEKMNFMQMAKALYQISKPLWHDIPRYGIPQCKPDLSLLTASNEGIKFIWLGHSSVLVRMDQQSILIDPMFSTYASPIKGTFKRFQAPVLALEELPAIDVIVISHDHYDHLDKKSIQFFKSATTKFIVPLRVGHYLKKWGISKERIIELNWYESYTLNEIVYTATPAHHFSGRTLLGRNKTLWASWVIQSPHRKLFFSGDSAYSSHFKDIGEKYGPFDLAFMENGQYNEAWLHAHMMPNQSVQAMMDIQAKLCVPIHWSMFRLSKHHWLEPMQRLLQHTENTNLSILYPFIGEFIALPH